MAGSSYDNLEDTEEDSLLGTPFVRFFEASPEGVNPFVLGGITEGCTQAYLGREKHFDRYGVYGGLP